MADELPAVATTVRTLLAAGFTVSGSRRRPRLIVISCERIGLLGAVSRYLVAVTDAAEFSEDERADINAQSEAEHRAAVFIATDHGEDQLSWQEFTEALGGAVPTWRALAESYPETLRTLSENRLPDGTSGKAWRMFEEAVADGLEFLFGRRVHRLGGGRRGSTVSDMVAQLPNLDLVVVDAKAAKDGFKAGWPAMRPVGEYLQRQIHRQRGQNRVIGAVVVSSRFLQDGDALRDLSLRFNAEFGATVAFMPAEILVEAVRECRVVPRTRNALRWNQVFAGGLVESSRLAREISQAVDERYGGLEG